MSELRNRVIAYNAEIKEALQTILDALKRGQRKKLLKNPAVKAMMERYGIDTTEDDVSTETLSATKVTETTSAT